MIMFKMQGALVVVQSATWSTRTIGQKGRMNVADTFILPSMVGRNGFRAERGRIGEPWPKPKHPFGNVAVNSAGPYWVCNLGDLHVIFICLGKLMKYEHNNDGYLLFHRFQLLFTTLSFQIVPKITIHDFRCVLGHQ